MTSDEWNYFCNITNVFAVTFDQINASFWTKVLLYYKNLLTPNFCTVVYNMYIMSNKQDNVQSAVNYHKIALDKKIKTPVCKGVVNFAIMNRHS